jgi:TctA family transporter
MSVLHNLALGFSVASSASNLFYCFIGALLGTMIGVLPGVGPLVTIAVLLPLTFGLPPEGALIMLAGIYYGAAYGGSTTAILMNLPGESSSVMTCVDGHQMARQGRAGPALVIAAVGSLAAGCIGTLLIALFGPPLTELALRFGPAEYFSLMLVALVSTAALASKSLLKAIGMAVFGILFGLVGTDVYSGVKRFTFGVPGLYEGIDFVIVAMGLFAFADIVHNIGHPEQRASGTAKITTIMPTRADFRAATPAIFRGTIVGSIFGILPGAGQTISSFAAYMVEKRFARDPSRFGQGAIEGVAAPESANNAAAQTAFIPTLTLGIPGSATMALILGALMIQGITPGPQVMTERPSLFWGLIASMWIGNLILVILNLPLVGIWVKMLSIPYRWLCALILMFSCIGVYSVDNDAVSVGVAAFFGLLGFIFLKLGCEPAPFILGFILGPMMEENFRRAMLLSQGDPRIFLSSPISIAFLLVAAFLVVSMIFPQVRARRDEAIEESE